MAAHSRACNGHGLLVLPMGNHEHIQSFFGASGSAQHTVSSASFHKLQNLCCLLLPVMPVGFREPFFIFCLCQHLMLKCKCNHKGIPKCSTPGDAVWLKCVFNNLLVCKIFLIEQLTAVLEGDDKWHGHLLA